MTDDDLIKFMLINAIAHLLEFIQTGEELDFAAASGNMDHPLVAKYAATMDETLLPLRRDGKPALEMSL